MRDQRENRGLVTIAVLVAGLAVTGAWARPPVKDAARSGQVRSETLAEGVASGGTSRVVAGGGVTVLHDYRLDGTLADDLGGPALVSAGGTLDATGYAFGPNQGLSLANSSIDPEHYSIELIFSLSVLGDYRKFLDFKDLDEDPGLHVWNTGLNFFPLGIGPNSALTPDVPVHLLVTRDAGTGVFSAYINGTRHLNLNDPQGEAVFDGPNNVIQLFKDDFVTGQSEASAGRVDRIRIFDGPFSPAEAFEVWRNASTGRQTLGLFQATPAAFDGYTLFGTLTTGPTYLIDRLGRRVHEWISAYPTGNSVYLMPNGDLLRASRFPTTPQAHFNAGGRGGRIERFDWDGNLLWDFLYATEEYRHHHDIAPLPNGNVLLIAWELKTEAEAIQAGRAPDLLPDGELYPEKIVEIEPDGPTGGKVVWEWRVWDHLIQDHDPSRDNFGVVEDHPELIDINFVNGDPGQADWLHANAIDYNPERDEIVLGIPFLDEIWVIDHSTTTEEAAGHTGGNRGKGGDLLYRWGNAASYRRNAQSPRRLWSVHDAEWIDAGLAGAGRILAYNNGVGRPGGDASEIVEIVPPIDVNGDYVIEDGQAFGPAAPAWSYMADPPADFYGGFLSSAQRLPNGNTLIGNGPKGDIFEVQPDGTEVWRYVNPVSVGGSIQQGVPVTNRLFRAERYAPDHPGLAGRDLTPGAPLELLDSPRPVPDGVGGTAPLTADRQDPAGAALLIQWDAGACPASGYQLIYGHLVDVAAYGLGGAECAIGTSGSFDWLAVPPGDLFYLVVGVDETGVYESSWGADSSGVERNGGTPSFQCDVTTKVSTETCP